MVAEQMAVEPLDVQIGKLTFDDGDICVLKMPLLSTPDQLIRAMAVATESVFKRAGVNVQVVTLDSGTEIEMLRRVRQSDA